VKNIFAEKDETLFRAPRRQPFLRRAAAASRPDPHKFIFSAQVFEDKMPLRFGGEKVVINIRRDIEKTVDRTPNEFDFERVQVTTIADASNVARDDRRAIDS